MVRIEDRTLGITDNTYGYTINETGWFDLHSENLDRTGGIPNPPDKIGDNPPLPSPLSDRLRRRRYTSCGHTGGLSCLCNVDYHY